MRVDRQAAAGEQSEPVDGDYGVFVELNVHAQTDADFARIAMLWLDNGSRMLMAGVRAALDADTDPPWREPESPDLPMGPPGAAWGNVYVARSTGGPPRLVHRPASVAGWRWLARQLQSPPCAAQVSLRRLDGTGLRAVDSRYLSVQHDDQFSGWMRLSTGLSASRILDPADGSAQQRQWLEFTRLFAEQLNPSYGQIGIMHEGGDETTLENRLPVDFGRNRAPHTVAESRRLLRGYTWVTILAQELADQLGGASALASSGVFWEVAQLRAGGVWLQTTEDFRAYDQAKAEQLFVVLAPVLRPGTPTPPDLNPNTGMPHDAATPHLIVYEDAGRHHGG